MVMTAQHCLWGHSGSIRMCCVSSLIHTFVVMLHEASNGEVERKIQLFTYLSGSGHDIGECTVDRTTDSRSNVLEFDPHFWHASGKFLNPTFPLWGDQIGLAKWEHYDLR